jgi:hypothetical protein
MNSSQAQPRRDRPVDWLAVRRRAFHATLATFATAGLVLAAGCGGAARRQVAQLGSTATTTQTASSAQHNDPTAFSRCMRSHGVPKYPDPLTNGQLPKVSLQQLGISSSQFQSAQFACRDLYPAGSSLQQEEAACGRNDDCSPAVVQQWLVADLKLARCMRSHGTPNFPDPASGGASGPYFPISKVGISDAASHEPQFMAELSECGRLVGDTAPEAFG